MIKSQWGVDLYHKESIKIKEELLKQKEKLVGGVTFILGDTKVDITGTDGIGGLIEEWIGVWSKKQGFNIEDANTTGNTQTFPDYYIEDGYLLEIKTFRAKNGPGFDIANFDAYCRSVADNPSRTDADYLILSYEMSSDGGLSIENVWLKKIWEITRPSKDWPLNVQVKQGDIYNIRPATWYSDRSKFKTFNSKEEFIEALFKTQMKNKDVSLLDTYNTNK